MNNNYIHLLHESIQDKYDALCASVSSKKSTNILSEDNITDIPLSLLPYIIWKSLSKKDNQSIKLSLVHTLCFASHCEWNSYLNNYSFSSNSVLNDFCSYKALETYRTSTHEKKWHEYIEASYRKKIQALDTTQQHYSTIFHKTSSIIPLYSSKEIYVDKTRLLSLSIALLFSSSRSPTDMQILSLMDIVTNLIISCTLIHDLYSWQSQLAQGYISSISSNLLSIYNQRSSDIQKHHLNYEMTELNNIFWHEAIDRALIEIVTIIEECTQALEENELIKSPTTLLLIIKNLLASIKKIQKQQESIIARSSTIKPKLNLVQSPYM